VRWNVKRRTEGRAVAEIDESVADLVRNMLQQRLYVVTSTLTTSMGELKPLLLEHLHYLIELERRGTLYASGPFFDDSGSILGSSMTILRAGSREEAEAIAAADPLHARGIRTFAVQGWQVNEGSHTLTVHYSRGTFSVQ
jgi:uncharacterized protein YciI